MARILPIDDDAGIRRSVLKVLTIDLGISDMMMPEMSGLELRQRLNALRPALPVRLMSGYLEEAITRLGNPGSLDP